MKFFDWLFKKNNEVFVTEMPMTLLNRWFLYDTGIGNENDLAEAIGLTRVSEEGDSKEREDSDKRIDEVAYLIPFMDHISTLTAEAIGESQKSFMMEDGMSLDQADSDLEVVKRVYKAIALSSLLAGFSIATALEFIETHPDVFIEEDEVLDER